MNAALKDKLLKTADHLVGQGLQFFHRERTDTLFHHDLARWRAQALNYLDLLGRKADVYAPIFRNLDTSTEHVQAMVGTLSEIESAIGEDLFITVEGMVLADAFADLLEQAEHLMSRGYHRAAGVLARAVLEEHLRKWCDQAKCIPTKAQPTINDYNMELYKHNRIDKVKMKHVESLTVVGNDAAHAKPIRDEEVERMVRDTRDFIASNSLS